MRVEYISASGSENTHELVYDNWIEIIPETKIKLPQIIKIRTYARSPSGIGWKGRGWTKIKVTGEFTKYKNLP